MITVAREDDKTLRVSVLPTKSSDSENPALTTPLSYTGTPEELDAELGRELAGYVECHRALGSTLAAAEAEMDAAAKAASDRSPVWQATRERCSLR
jgi:PRTRC genetic system protein E